MARGNECKIAAKASYPLNSPQAYKAPVSSTSKAYQSVKKEEKTGYGAWGPIYKDKKTFVDMHFC